MWASILFLLIANGINSITSICNGIGKFIIHIYKCYLAVEIRLVVHIITEITQCTTVTEITQCTTVTEITQCTTVTEIT